LNAHFAAAEVPRAFEERRLVLIKSSAITPTEIEKLVVSAEDDALANEIHRRFSAYEGSQHIASPASLRWFAAILRTFQPANILELGAGIGTMTEMMLIDRYATSRVFTTETDAFCLEALKKNLSKPNDPRLQILTSENDLRKIQVPLDLIVGDGGFYSPLEFENSKEGTVLFFDGSRSKLRAIAQETLARKGLECEMKQLGTNSKMVWDVKHVFGLPIPFRRKQRDTCWVGGVERA
jgi:hypothetical protein